MDKEETLTRLFKLIIIAFLFHQISQDESGIWLLQTSNIIAIGLIMFFADYIEWPKK